MTTPLAQNARIVAELRCRLKAEYGLEDGDAVLEDTLQGATNLPELLARLARDAKHSEAQSEAVKAIMRDNGERAARLDRKAEKLRASIAQAMSEAGMERIPDDVLPDLTVTMHEGKPPLVIPAEELVPDEWCRRKTVSAPDKQAIRDALERGERFDFAHLGNSMPTLTIRTK